MKTHYSTLGVGREFEEAELKAAWRALAWTMHPDRHGGTQVANDAFATITAAYAVLSDRKQKKAYDAGLVLLTDPCQRCQTTGIHHKRSGFTISKRSVCSACQGCGRIER